MSWGGKSAFYFIRASEFYAWHFIFGGSWPQASSARKSQLRGRKLVLVTIQKGKMYLEVITNQPGNRTSHFIKLHNDLKLYFRKNI